MGSTGSGSHDNSTESKSIQPLHLVPGPSSKWGRCSNIGLELQTSLCLSPLPLIPRMIRKLRGEKTTLILIDARWPRRTWFSDLLNMSIDEPASTSRSPLTGANPPSKTGEPKFDSVALETMILKQNGFSDAAVREQLGNPYLPEPTIESGRPTDNGVQEPRLCRTAM